MITISLEFKEEDAARFFQSNGIRVTEGKVSTLFGSKQGPLMVTNPGNGQQIPLDKAFHAVMGVRTKQLLLTEIDKLTIFSTLNTLK
jgi:hypothetical protein